jgi:Uma2 family endonuclease
LLALRTCDKNVSVEAALNPEWIRVEDYLEGESHSDIRHEFVAGQIFAMAGASEEHNLIAGNLFAALHGHLRGKSCRVFTLDMKVRLAAASSDVFYYPDVLITCDPRDKDRFFKRYPSILVEVLSPETERTDRREKFVSYTQIRSLEEYVLVAQDKVEVTLFRRANHWQPEVLKKPEQLLELRSVDFRVTLSTLYEGVKL